MKNYLLLIAFNICFISLFGQSDPLNMTLHAQWDADTLPTAGSREYNDIWGWVDCSANEYAIIGSAAYIHFFDVTNPNAINELAFFEGGGVTTWRDMKTYEDRAYAVSDNTSEGLMIFDLSDIQNTIIKSYHSNEHFNSAHNIYIDEDNGRLYAVGTNTQSQGVIIFDIDTDPDNPIVIGSINLPGGGYIHDIYVRDNIGYCSHGYNGFYIWDFTDPQNPVYIIDFATTGYNHSNWVTDDGNYLIFAEEVPLGLPLGILDISDIQNGNISQVSSFKFPLLAPDHVNNVPHNPFIRGDYAIVSYYHDGLQIFDISDPANPQQVAYYDSHANDSYSGYSGNWGVYPFLPSGNIIASDINEGLLLLTADSLNLAAVAPPVMPDLSNFTIDSLEFCGGETSTIQAPSGFEEYEWIKDGVVIQDGGTSLEVSETGVYRLRVTNNGFCSAESADIIVNVPNPDATILNTDFEFCVGEEYILEAASGSDSYQWYMGSTFIITTNFPFYIISEPGEYSVNAYLGDCSNSSTSVNIVVNDLPNAGISVSGDIITQDDTSASFCEGNSVILEVPSTANTDYSWTYAQQPVGTNTNTLEVSEAGIYQVEVVDDNNCQSLSLEFTIEIISSTSTISFDNDLLQSEAASSYQWFLNGIEIPGANSIDYEPTESGTYNCVILSFEGCESTSNSIDIIIDFVNDTESLDYLSIFPNPAKSTIAVNMEVNQTTEFTFEIIDVNGVSLTNISRAINGVQSINMDIKHLPSGIYFLKITNQEGQVIRKIVKQ